jgi:signal transduction histidine kinase/ligand-binding sensor domain-containing protein/CheY-like chemotaxis protein/HPt (histidine-containing phosphotransfer) domain-containing protein
VSIWITAGKWRWWLWVGLLWTLGVAVVDAAADAPPIVLEHLTTADGLPQSTVHVVLQDSQGFIWLGTEDGLVRYDGHDLFRYAYSPTAQGGLPGSFIQAIVEDAHHDLWIAVKDAGLARWNRATDRFTVYRHDPAQPGSLASDAVGSILIDARGRVWVGSDTAGLDVLDPATGQIEHRVHDPARAGSLTDNRVTTLLEDRSGRIWIGTMGGLDLVKSGGETFTHYRHFASDPKSLSSNEISRVYEDRAGSLWIGTYDAGLDQMGPDGRVTNVFRHESSQAASLQHDDVRSILEDRAGRVWVATADGLDLLNRATGSFMHYRHDDRDARSLSDSEVMSLYEDAAGLVWIGTRTGGVDRWNPRSWELGGFRPDWLSGRPVTAFADGPDHKLWVGSLGKGLVLFDPATGESTDSDSIAGRPSAIGDQRVMSLRLDRGGRLWIGTRDHGLSMLSADGRLTSVPVKPGDPRGLSAAGIMTIFEAKDGKIWIGTHGGGVNVLDPLTGLVRQLPYGPATPGAISSPNVGSFAEDQNGNLWIGNDGDGLDLARPDGTVVKSFRHRPEDATSLSANGIFAITADSDGRVWVATDGGGLNLIHGSSAAPESIRFENLSRAEGLSSDTIYGVLVDPVGRLWMSGNSGLMRYDPRTRAVKSFHVEHGLQGEEFESGAFLKLRDGRLCFGGPSGFNIFDPSNLTEQSHPPRLALMQLEVLGVPLQSTTPYWLLDRIDVDDRASIISLDFGTLDFASPKRTRLAYRLPRLSDQWIDLGTQHRVTLTNLDAGDHVLEVRAASADSSWSESPLRIKIHRDPLPWRSPWAYAGYVAGVLGLIAYGLRRQRRKIREGIQAQVRLEAEVAARTRELVASNAMLEEAAKAKSDFLARMSHELRTPMNGVIGMAELLERTRQSDVQTRLTKTIRSSAGVLLRIVNDLLDLAKAQVGKIELESLPIDLGMIIEEAAALVAPAAAAKGLELTVCPPEALQGQLLGDPLRIRQVLLNLIGNAIKFTERGDVIIEANARPETGDRAVVDIAVVDTGIGMSSSAIGKIFDPFTQADESMSRRFGGTGLGLAICRELVSLMGGTITVESQPGAGSTFRVTIPLKLQTAAERAASTAIPLLNGPVRIMSRKPALARALMRHARRFGLTVIECDTGSTGTASVGEEVVVVDAGSYAEFAQSPAAIAHSSRPRLVVVATVAEVEALGLADRLDTIQIVAKPVQRDVLYQALVAASGAVTLCAIAEVKSPTTFATAKGHVLIVEDDSVNAEVAQGYLAALGCTSVWVDSGAAAIARSAAERFDLILMDLNMPDLDGFATAALIRQRGGASGRVPIVALTAHEAKNYRDACLTAGLDDLLSKPYTLAACATLLQRWLGRPVAHSDGITSSSATPAAALSRAVFSQAALSQADPATVGGLRSLASSGPGALYSRLVDLFRSNSPAELTKLSGALTAGDILAATKICHKLKSSAANVGALAFANGVAELESLCAGGKAQEARQHYEALAMAHPQLLDTLQSLCMRASA